jgi:hypothetical protein
VSQSSSLSRRERIGNSETRALPPPESPIGIRHSSPQTAGVLLAEVRQLLDASAARKQHHGRAAQNTSAFLSRSAGAPTALADSGSPGRLQESLEGPLPARGSRERAVLQVCFRATSIGTNRGGSTDDAGAYA